jgi:hypothetical protein
MASTRARTDLDTWYDQTLTRLTHRPGPTERVLLAVIVRALAGGPDAPAGHDNPTRLRTWFRTANIPPAVRQLAVSAPYKSLHHAARRHLATRPSTTSPSPAAASRTAMSLVASLLAPSVSSVGDGRRRNRLAAPLTVLVGLEILGDEKRWSTALVTHPKLAVGLGCSTPRAREALRRAVDDRMLAVVSERPGGGRRVRLPGRLTPTAELVAWSHPETVAAVASWRAGDPLPEDPTAAVICSVRHPAWGYGDWVDSRSGEAADGWDLWAVSLAMVSGSEPAAATGMSERTTRRLARVASDYGLGWGGDELARILDQVADDSDAQGRRNEAEQARRRVAAERAAAVSEHRVSSHVAALVDAVGALPDDLEGRRAWTSKAVEFGGARLIRPASDRPAVIAATTGVLVDAGVEPARAGRIAKAIWVAPETASNRAA